MTVPVDFFDVIKEYMHLYSVIQELSSVHSQHQVGSLDSIVTGGCVSFIPP